MFRIRRRFAYILMRLVQRARITWYQVISTNGAIGNPVLHQPLQLVGNGRIRFGENVRIGVFPSPSFMDSYAYIEARGNHAEIQVGAGTWINNGFRCIAEHTSITIGKNCLLGANVEILDSDFHGFGLDERGVSKPEWARPVVLEDNVFIGSNARILKGARIGTGSVIANSSLVVGDIPAMVVAGGMPAKVIRAIS